MLFFHQFSSSYKPQKHNLWTLMYIFIFLSYSINKLMSSCLDFQIKVIAKSKIIQSVLTKIPHYHLLDSYHIQSKASITYPYNNIHSLATAQFWNHCQWYSLDGFEVTLEFLWGTRFPSSLIAHEYYVGS